MGSEDVERQGDLWPYGPGQRRGDVFIMEHHLAIKWNKLFMYSTTGVNLQRIRPRVKVNPQRLQTV